MFVVQTSTLYYLQACTENLQKIEGVCMQINQLVTESRVEVEDNSIVWQQFLMKLTKNTYMDGFV